MEASENRVLKPFDTVINFNEDFHFGPETSIKNPLSAMSTIDTSSKLNPMHTRQTSSLERKTKTVLTVCKRSSPTLHKMQRRSRSKTRGTYRASNRISFSTEQMLPQAYFHYQLPVSESSQTPLFQLRSYSPPEREYPYSMKRPLKTTGHHSNRRILVTKSISSEVDPSTSEDMCPALRSIESDRRSIENKLLMNTQTMTDTKYFQMQFTKEKSEGSIKQGLKINRSVHGRAHSCEHFSRSDLAAASQLYKQNPNQESLAKVVNLGSENTNKAVSLCIKTYEDELKSLREQLERRTQEAEQISEELLKVKQEEKHIQSRLKDSLYTDSLKEDTVLNLKSKIAELYADLESLRCAHTQALDRQVDLQEEITTLRRSCDWYAEQLHLTKSVRDKACIENEKLQALLRESGEINHRLTHENTCLQTQLVCSRAESVTAKRNLSTQLDAIRIDMIEREALFERFANERSSLEQLCMERAGQICALQTQVNNLQTELKAAEELIAKQHRRLEYLELCVYSVDSERSELQEKLFHAEQKQTMEDLHLNQQYLSCTAALNRLKELEEICEEKDKALSAASEEKASLEAELSAAFKEKDILNSYLNRLKENLTRIEESFDKARYELDSKQTQLIESADHRDYLCKQIEVLQLQLKNSSGSISDLKQEKTNLTDLVDELQIKVPSRIDVFVQTDVEPHWTENPLRIHNQTYTGSLSEKAFSFQDTPADWKVLTSESGLGLSEHPCTLKQVTHIVEKPHTFSPESLLCARRVDHGQSDQKMSNQERINGSGQQLTHTEKTQNDPQDKPIKSDQFYELAHDIGRFHSPPWNDTSSLVGLPSEQSSFTPLSIIPIKQVEYHHCFTESPKVAAPLDAKLKTSSPKHSELFPMNYEKTHFRSYQPHLERVVFLPPNAMENRLSSYQSETLNDGADHSTDYVCQKLVSVGASSFSDGADHGSNAAQTQAVAPLTSTVGKHMKQSPATDSVSVLFSPRSAFEEDSVKRVERYSRASQGLLSDDVVESGEAPVIFSSYGTTTKDINNQTISKFSPERELPLKALDTATKEASEALAKLEAARHEVDVQSAKANQESLARRKAVEAQFLIMEELNSTKNKLNEVQSELDKLRNETKDLQKEAGTLRTQQDAYKSAHMSELDALRAIIKTTTEQLVLLSTSLNQANQENAVLQTELARLKGALRAELDRYRLFSQLNPTGPLDTSFGEENQSLVTMMVSLGWDIQNLESLLENGVGLSMLNSKPLNRLNKCFENLQLEINSLQDEIVHHAIAVHDTVRGSLEFNTENALANVATTQSCDREP